VGYILLEPRTKALIAIDIGEYDVSEKVVTELEKRHNTQLKYIFSTHHHDAHVGGNLKWKE
jgi:glyoxylase-like metal-dependent hydrolase (beta-lactamase superfamily II)